MPYLIDSDIIIDHLASVQAANQLLEDLAPEGIAISIITYMEASQRVSRSHQPQNAQSKFRDNTNVTERSIEPLWQFQILDNLYKIVRYPPEDLLIFPAKS